MAKDTIHFSLVPNSRDTLIADLHDVFLSGTMSGVDFRPLRRKKGESRSRLIQYAIARGGAACRAERISTALALPETTSNTDADRLARAMTAAGFTSPKALALHLGYADKASVQNVKTKGMKLCGALKAWVESIEATL